MPRTIKISRFLRKSLTVRNLSLLLFSMAIIGPLLTVVFTSLKTMKEFVSSPLSIPKEGTVNNYIRLFKEYHMQDYFLNSAIFTAGTVVAVIFLTSMIAFACVRLSGWKGSVIFGLFVIGMLIPAQVNMIPLYSIVLEMEQLMKAVAWLPDLQFRDTLYGLIVIKTAVLLSLSVFILTGFMKTVPKELFEAAAVDGSSEWWMYSKVAVPLSLPAIASSSIFLCVIVWNDLLYPLLFTGEKAKTLTMVLLMFRGEYESNYPMLFAAVLTASLPMILAYLFFQRWFIAGITSGSIKG